MKSQIKSIATLAVGVSLFGATGYFLYLLFRKDDDDYNEIPINVLQTKLEMKIPKESVRNVIGRNGFQVREIERKSQTRITFKEVQPEDKFRICVIRGANKNCGLAENLIHEILSHQPVIEQKELWVPCVAIGRIIGRCGERISYITQISGAKIHVSEADSLDATEKRITMKGTSEQIELAKCYIVEIIREDAEVRRKMETRLAQREPRGKQKMDTTKIEPSKKQSSEKLSSDGGGDGQIEVYVSAVTDPSQFHLQIVGPKANELDQLVEEMTEYYNIQENQELHRIIKPQIGEIVAGLFQHDNKWYRAEIIDIKPKQDVKEDSEEEETIRNESENTEKNQNIVKNKLHNEKEIETVENGLAKAEKEPKTAEKEFASIEKNLTENGENRFMPEKSFNTVEKELSTIEKELNSIEKGFPIEIGLNSTEKPKTDLKSVEKEFNITERKFNTAENDLSLTENTLESTENTLESTENALQSTENTIQSTENDSKYSENDSKYSENNSEEIVAELLFLDYGDNEEVPLSQILELRTDFLRLRFQAIECYLAKVIPKDGIWSEESIDKFCELTQVAQWKKLRAKISGYKDRTINLSPNPEVNAINTGRRHKREGSPIPGVDLYDVNFLEDLDIGLEMVKNGYAVLEESKKNMSSSTTSIESKSSRSSDSHFVNGNVETNGVIL